MKDVLMVIEEIADNEVWIDGKCYWCPQGGGYVRLTTPNFPGTLGRQVCDRLQTQGSTLSCRGERLLTTLLRELPDGALPQKALTRGSF